MERISTTTRALALAPLVAAMLCLPVPCEAQQDLGHRVLGAVGLDAGSLLEPGVYLGDRALLYSANRLLDRHGDSIPVSLRLNAFANGFGVAGAIKVAPLATHLSASASVPVAHVSVHTARPEASLDRFGLGDVFVQPLQLGWRLPRLDIVTGYAFYAPTARVEPGGQDGVGSGSWTHELSLGGTLCFDRARAWRVSALASYDLNTRKRRIDITRGETLQLQGGAGATVARLFVVGLAGYAQWQVRDDRGADLPPVLRGARDRAFGLGPEVDLLIPPIRSKLILRYAHDFATRSRPLGQIFVVGFSFIAWRPPTP
jgi:hypothetical protein